MRRCLSAVLVLTLGCFVAGAADPPRSERDLPDLPGVFHPFNVTGKFKGRYHSLVTEHDLDPGVLLFVSVDENPNLSDPLKELLRKLDNAIVKNPDVRLAAYVVFLNGKLPDVVKNDDERELLAAELGKAHAALELKNVEFSLDSKMNLEKYALKDEAEVTVILYRKLRVLARFTFAKGELTPEKVTEVMAAVKGRFGASRE
jgi:hypothetical protein